MTTSERIRIDSGAATSVGLVRDNNEDAWLIQPRLYAVADGMGGHAAGERASALAIGAMERLAEHDDFDVDALLASVATANHDIVAEAAERSDERGMGTTLTGVAIVEIDGEDQWVVFNVGDSRVYADTGEGLTQITVDHSQVQQLIDAGLVRPEEAETHPLSNWITRSLGRARAPKADHWVIPMAPGQLFLACSDGVPLELDLDRIAELLDGEGSAQERAERLIEAVDDAGGRDNSTAVVVMT